MEFDLIYPNYNKQKERQKRKQQQTNKQKNVVNNDGSLAVFAWFSVRCRKKTYIYVIRNITPSCRPNQATLF